MKDYLKEIFHEMLWMSTMIISAVISVMRPGQGFQIFLRLLLGSTESAIKLRIL